MNVVSCLKWLPRRYCPRDFFEEHTQIQEDSYGNDKIKVEKTNEDDEIEKKFDLGSYDDDGLLPNEHLFTISDRDEKFLKEDDEDLQARILEDSDRVVIAGTSSDDAASLDFYLYNSDYCGLEVNHTILLSSFPLCCELVPNLSNFSPLVAVGTFESQIDLWAINEVDNLIPQITLKAGKKRKIQKADGHNGAVMALSSSPHVGQLLASGSADNTVKVWDLVGQDVLHTYTYHSDKVQVVSFNPGDPCTLLSGSFDRRVVQIDLRSSKLESYFSVESDVDCSLWSEQRCIVVGLEDGSLVACDTRNTNQYLWNIKAHKKACTSILRSKDLLVTCGLDSKARVFLLKEDGPVKISRKNLNAGPLFSVSGSYDDEHLVGFGGDVLVIWDMSEVQIPE